MASEQLAFVPAELDAPAAEVRERARSRSRPRGYSVSGPDVDRDGFNSATVALSFAITAATRSSAYNTNGEPCSYYVRECDTLDGLYRLDVTRREVTVHTIREEPDAHA